MSETLESDVAMVTTADDEEVINRGEEAEPTKPIQNPTTSPHRSSSDDDSGSDDSDSDALQNLQMQTLEAELSSNPSNYDAHVQYIRCLRKQGLIEKLREAREAMSLLFPLSPAMWQEWAKDEASLASSRPEAFRATEELYERGVFDYLSVSLWCDYLNFIQEYDPSVCEFSQSGILKMRNLFERAVTAVGLHVAEGNKIWEAYREFELAIFHSIDEADVEAREKQVQRIRSIFHRQLSIPLVSLESTLISYRAWEVEQGNSLDVNSTDTEGIASHVASAFRKALEMYNARAHFEEQLSGHVASDPNKLQQFMAYIKFEESSGDPARVQILYERAITEFPITSDLWLEYTRYLDRTLKVGSVVKDVYSRATKNCPWVGELWDQFFLSMERGRSSEKEISAVFEKSLLCTFSTFEEYLNIFLTRVDGLRRRISAVGDMEDGLDYALIRDTFQRASDYLSPHLKNTDSLLHLHAYWACLELSLGKDLTGARRVWENFLKISGSLLEAWKGYISMEIGLGHIKEARSIYRRCYSKRFPEMGSEDICHSWLRFEREYGTLEDFDLAVRKVTPRLDELQLFKLHQESKGGPAPADQKGSLCKKNANEKRKPDANIAYEQPLAKRLKNTVENRKKVSGKDKTHLPNPVEASEGEGINTEVDKALGPTEQKMEDFSAEKTKLYADKCTAFISNLSHEVNYECLRDFFRDVGGVVAIRILTNKFTGISRGLAYVDFCDDAHLAAAVAKNKQFLLGKKLSIARSDPSQSRNKGNIGLRASTEHGKRAGRSNDRKGSDFEETNAKSKEPMAGRPPLSASPRLGNDNVQFKGKNTFAVPRAVKPLGWIPNRPNNEQSKTRHEREEDEKPKSNDEFRKMFIKN